MNNRNSRDDLPMKTNIRVRNLIYVEITGLQMTLKLVSFRMGTKANKTQHVPIYTYYSATQLVKSQN
jgi:hypothetical protein